MRLQALLIGVLLGALTVPALAQSGSSPSSTVALPPTIVPAHQVGGATPTVEIPAAVGQLLERYAQAIASEDLDTFEGCFWQPVEHVARLKEVFKHFFSVRLKYLQMAALPGATTEQLVLKVKMQTRFRENRTRKAGQYDLLVEFHLERRRGEWRIHSIPDPQSQT